jgi:DNA-directed DNA polymerase III PolC
MATSFIHLHCHSNYSLLNSTIKLQDLVGMAVRMGMPAVALTDTKNLYGAVEFYELARSAGLKPIIGAEIVLQDESSVVLLVKNSDGYHNLCEIITQGNLQGGHLGFEMNADFITGHAGGLICLCGGKRGSIHRHLQRRNRRQAVHQALMWRETFRDDFYIELQNHYSRDDFLTTYLSDFARAHKIGTVATNDVHMVRPHEYEIWRVLRAVDENSLVSEIDQLGDPEQYFKSPSQMQERFGGAPEALENTLGVAEKCAFEFSLGKPIFPEVDLAPGETAFRRLHRLCETGLKKRYKPVTDESKDRLERELDTITNLGFVEYFLIVKDIVDFCHGQGIPCVGRGSAADSIVSYVLGITKADPIRYNLYFERFLNPERTDAPDIDLDLCWKNRERVLHYVYEKYSHDRTALISTFVTFQLRSSIREIAKTMGLPEDEIKQLTRDLPHYGVKDLDTAISKVPECHSLEFLKDGNGRESVMHRILVIANHISGFPRHLSVHPGGTIIAPKKITYYTPLEIAGGGLVISQYDMYSIEKLGLVKMDFLGVRSLSVVSDTVKLVKQRCGVELEIDAIAEDDPGTLAMIKSAETIGCFQLESPAMRGLIRKVRVENLDDVIAAISLVRPGPSEGGMKEVYIRRRAGLEETKYPHPLLEPILKETYGIILYQEQVLLVAQAIAGFTLGEADVLRRAMTKSRKDDVIRPLYDRFIEGAAKNGIDVKTARGIWEWLSHFVGYGFNKAHSSTYGLLAYQTAYLKRYFPVEYMTSVLNNEGGFYARFAYVEEARRMGVSILPPDVMKSGALFSIEGKAIRSGLACVFELRESVIRKLISERRRNHFRDLFDVILRTGMNEREAENLARCGAFEFFEASEAMALTKIRIFFKNHRRRHLVDALSTGLSLPPYPKYQRILNELEILRFAVRGNPLSLFLDSNPGLGCTSSTELEGKEGQRVTVIGWVITSRRVSTAGGGYMKFLTLEDLWGTIEVVLFPPAYRQAAKTSRLSGPLQVIGTIQSRVPGEANLIGEKVVPLRLAEENRIRPEQDYALAG